MAFFQRVRERFLYFHAVALLAVSGVRMFSTAPELKQICASITEGLLAGFALFLVICLFQMHREMLSKVEEVKHSRPLNEPPTHDDFFAAAKDIKERLLIYLQEDGQLSLKIIGVSARYSWPFLESWLMSYFTTRSSQNKSSPIRIEFAIAQPVVLERYGCSDWALSGKSMREQIEVFKKHYAEQMRKHSVEIEMYDYDNLPHWHGLLINEETLFLGRTEWNFCEGGPAKLKVGEVEYRVFTKDDSHGGERRILRFSEWHRRYVQRHLELTGTIVSLKAVN